MLPGLLLAPAVAYADPCEGRFPDREGATFSALVRHVGDGDNLCFGTDANPVTWIEMRWPDYNTPSSTVLEG